MGGAFSQPCPDVIGVWQQSIQNYLGEDQKKKRKKQKEKISPQSDFTIARNFEILPPKSGEDQKKVLHRKSVLTSAGISDSLE